MPLSTKLYIKANLIEWFGGGGGGGDCANRLTSRLPASLFYYAEIQKLLNY